MDNLFPEYIKKAARRITDKDIPLLASCAVSRSLKKGEILLKEGEICRSFYLVEKGYLRSYFDKDGVDINLNFSFEGDFTTNLRSINNKQPSDTTIEAGEDTSVWIFNLDAMTARYDENSQISYFVRRTAIYVLLAQEEHSNLLKRYTSSERYEYMEKNYPHLLQRISLSQLASYLGVTRETLSRIRAKRH